PDRAPDGREHPPRTAEALAAASRARRRPERLGERGALLHLARLAAIGTAPRRLARGPRPRVLEHRGRATRACHRVAARRARSSGPAIARRHARQRRVHVGVSPALLRPRERACEGPRATADATSDDLALVSRSRPRRTR